MDAQKATYATRHTARIMNADPSHDVGSLLVQALDLPPEERPAFLDEACPDAALRAEVEGFLQDYLDAESLFDGLDDGLRNQFLSLAQHTPALDDDDPHGLVGQTVAHYEILEKLGGGGMGVVYKAHDTKLKRTVALKFLPPLLSHNAQAQQRFLTEAQAAAALEHPHICTVYEIGQTNQGQYFIAMACYEGKTLKTRLADGPLSLEATRNYAVQMAEGLARAHEAGIVHRDIKPANVMVTDRGRVKILDFGLAKVSDVSLTKTGTTMGTVAYMSPEQARGESVDHRTDIWSLGVVLYEMLTGIRPFQGDYEHAVTYAILHEEPASVTTLRDDVPEVLAQITEQALAKDPATRYQEMSAMLAALKTLDTGAAPVLAASRAVPVRSRKKNVLIGSMMGLVLLLALWALWPSRGEPERSPSVAVLPFDNLSPDSADVYFSDGVTEDIIAHLSQIGALRVAPRATSMRYRASDKSPQEIVQELNVATLLTGSVRRYENQVRIVVELIDPTTNDRLWGNEYDRELENIFSIQREVAREIAAELKATLSPAEEQRLDVTPTTSLTAYDYYLKGRDYYSRYTKEDNEQAVTLFTKAIEADPNYADAYAGLADTYNQRAHRFGFEEAWLDSSLVQVEKALAIDPNSAAAYKAKGLMYEVREHYRQALEAHRNALNNNPDYGGPNTGYTYLRLGDVEQGHFWLKQHWTRDPTFAMGSSDLGDVFTVLQDYERATSWYEQALEMQPDFYEARLFLANLESIRGRAEQGVTLARQVLQALPNDKMALWTTGFGEMLLGNDEQARQVFDRYVETPYAPRSAPAHFAPTFSSVRAMQGYLALRQEQPEAAAALFRQSLDRAQHRLDKGSEDPWIYYDIATVNAVQGRHAEAYAALEQAIDGGWRITDRARIDPMLTSLHGETRFEDLLRRVDAMVAEARTRIEATDE